MKKIIIPICIIFILTVGLFVSGKFIQGNMKINTESNTVTQCQKHPGGKLKLNESGVFGFDDDSEYVIKLIALQKEIFNKQSTYLAKFEINGNETASVRIYDIQKSLYKPDGDFGLMIYDVANDNTVSFKLSKNCNLNTSGSDREIPPGYSEIKCNLYVGPGSYSVKPCDRIKASKGSSVSAYIEYIGGDGQIFSNYRIKTQKGEFEPSLAHIFLSADKNDFQSFGAGFFGLNLYLEKLHFNKAENTSDIQVTTDCKPVFNKCMENVGNIDACAFLCPFEKTRGYSLINIDNKIFGKAPEKEKEFNKCVTSILQNTLPKGEQYFSFQYPFPMISGLYINTNPLVDNAAYAYGWGTLGGIVLGTNSAFYKKCNSAPEDYAKRFTNSQHEVNHNFFNNSSLHDSYGTYPSIEEGLVNYVSNLGLPDADPPFLCLEEGYKFDIDGKLNPYGPKDTFSGQCFWQKIEEEYGHSTFTAITKKLDESRYIDPKAGRKKNALLFKDIINPIIGSDILQKRAYNWYGYAEDSL